MEAIGSEVESMMCAYTVLFDQNIDTLFITHSGPISTPIDVTRSVSEPTVTRSLGWNDPPMLSMFSQSPRAPPPSRSNTAGTVTTLMCSVWVSVWGVWARGGCGRVWRCGGVGECGDVGLCVKQGDGGENCE